MGDQVGVQSVCEPPLVVVRDISAVLLFSKQCEKVGLFPLPSSSPPPPFPLLPALAGAGGGGNVSFKGICTGGKGESSPEGKGMVNAGTDGHRG